MFSTNVRGGKAFAVEQKIRETKKRIFRLKVIEKRTKKTRRKPNQIIRKAAKNMNNLLTQKFGIAPSKTEKNLQSPKGLTDQVIGRHQRYENKVYKQKILRPRTPLEVGEEVLILSGRLKKKDIPGRFYKSRVENRPYFNKDTTYLITNRQKIDGINFYWIKNTKPYKIKFKVKNYFQYLKTFPNFSLTFGKKKKNRLGKKKITKKISTPKKFQHQKKFNHHPRHPQKNLNSKKK